VDEVAVLRAQLAAAEARGGALDAQFPQAVAATPGLINLEPKNKTFSARASPAPMSSQAPSAPASTGTHSRSSGVSSSSQESGRGAASLAFMVRGNRRSAFDGGADVIRHSSSARYRRYSR
jgi:hypothetical protein